MPRHYGDEGDTSLFDGARVPKTDLRIAALGDVDELNSVVGLVASLVPAGRERERLAWVQQRLFSMGAELANPGGRARSDRVTKEDVGRLDDWLESYRASLPPLQHFILPGGSAAGAAAQVARSVCRRAERSAYRLAQPHPIDPAARWFLNRLSDVLFELARQLNVDAGFREVEWRGPRDRPTGEEHDPTT